MAGRSFYAQSGNNTDGWGESYSAAGVRKATKNKAANARRQELKASLAAKESRKNPN